MTDKFSTFDFGVSVQNVSGEELANISVAQSNWTRVDVVKYLPKPPSGHMYMLISGESMFAGEVTLQKLGLSAAASTLTAILTQNPSFLALQKCTDDLIDLMVKDEDDLRLLEGLRSETMRHPYEVKLAFQMLCVLGNMELETPAIEGLKVHELVLLIDKDSASFENFVRSQTQAVLDGERDPNEVLRILAPHESYFSGNVRGQISKYICQWLLALYTYCQDALGKTTNAEDHVSLTDFFKQLLARRDPNYSAGPV